MRMPGSIEPDGIMKGAKTKVRNRTAHRNRMRRKRVVRATPPRASAGFPTLALVAIFRRLSRGAAGKSSTLFPLRPRLPIAAAMDETNRAWATLEAAPRPPLKTLFETEPDRVGALTVQEGGIVFDFSKTHLD